MQNPGRYFRYLIPAVLFLTLCSKNTLAHQQRMINADRTLAIRLGDGFIDLSVYMQYKEFPSLLERRAMDINSNGWIDEQEAATYVQDKSDRLLEALKLTVNDRPLSLKVLGEPKLEFFGSARVVPLHLDLKVQLNSPLKMSGPD